MTLFLRDTLALGSKVLVILPVWPSSLCVGVCVCVCVCGCVCLVGLSMCVCVCVCGCVCVLVFGWPSFAQDSCRQL